MTAITRELAEFVAGLSYDALPVEVRERVKALALDLVGIAVRARNDAESTPAMVAAAGLLGMTGGTCTVIGDAAGYAPPGAAMLNGTLAHSLDFDDTHAPGSLHPSAPIVPAAFAAAEMTGSDGKAAIAAIVAGYEVQIRLSLALDPAAHYDRGFHPTATCGAFGATGLAVVVALGVIPKSVTCWSMLQTTRPDSSLLLVVRLTSPNGTASLNHRSPVSTCPAAWPRTATPITHPAAIRSPPAFWRRSCSRSCSS